MFGIELSPSHIHPSGKCHLLKVRIEGECKQSHSGSEVESCLIHAHSLSHQHHNSKRHSESVFSVRRTRVAGDLAVGVIKVTRGSHKAFYAFS
jgi:hypothetical protein